MISTDVPDRPAVGRGVFRDGRNLPLGCPPVRQSAHAGRRAGNRMRTVSAHGTGDVHRRDLCAPRHRVHGPPVSAAPGVDGRPPRAGGTSVGRRVPGDSVAKSRACGRAARRVSALEPPRARRGASARRSTAGRVPPRHVDRLSPSAGAGMDLRDVPADLPGTALRVRLPSRPRVPDHSEPGGSRGVGFFELSRLLPRLSAFSGGGALSAAPARAAPARARPRSWACWHHRRGSASHRDSPATPNRSSTRSPQRASISCTPCTARATATAGAPSSSPSAPGP